MAFSEYLGEFVEYDIENNTLKIKINFITPEEQAKLEKGVLEQQQHKFKHRISNSTSVSQQQRECWYGSLRTIILKAELMPTAEMMGIFDERMRRSHFPAIDIDFGSLDTNNEESIPDPKRMREMTHDEMGNAIQALHNKYDNIDWSKYMEVK